MAWPHISNLDSLYKKFPGANSCHSFSGRTFWKNNSRLCGRIPDTARNIKTKKIIINGISQYKEDIPVIKGINKIIPPHAFLEVVRISTTVTVIKKEMEIYLFVLFLLSLKN